ncbi:hypothetical protein WME93_47380 [Sorangium sp. So ce1000]
MLSAEPIRAVRSARLRRDVDEHLLGVVAVSAISAVVAVDTVVAISAIGTVVAVSTVVAVGARIALGTIRSRLAVEPVAQIGGRLDFALIDVAVVVEVASGVDPGATVLAAVAGRFVAETQEGAALLAAVRYVASILRTPRERQRHGTGADPAETEQHHVTFSLLKPPRGPEASAGDATGA